MQSESGIVADFDVGEEFHEEPKTYYELKSQPLKNRSVNGACDSSHMHVLCCMLLKVWYLFAYCISYSDNLLFLIRVSCALCVHAKPLALLTDALIIMEALEARRVRIYCMGATVDNALGYNIISKYLLMQPVSV